MVRGICLTLPRWLRKSSKTIATPSGVGGRGLESGGLYKRVGEWVAPLGHEILAVSADGQAPFSLKRMKIVNSQ